jgi:hypothetical protein
MAPTVCCKFQRNGLTMLSKRYSPVLCWASSTQLDLGELNSLTFSLINDGGQLRRTKRWKSSSPYVTKVKRHKKQTELRQVAKGFRVDTPQVTFKQRLGLILLCSIPRCSLHKPRDLLRTCDVRTMIRRNMFTQSSQWSTPSKSCSILCYGIRL